MKTRGDMRQILDGIARLNKPAVRLTSLGMHYIDVEGSPVLVLVEINVPRLLAVSAKRLRESKRGIVGFGRGAVRVSLATPEGLEICGAARGSELGRKEAQKAQKIS